MEFRIANTFQDSLNRLTAQEQKAVKTAAFDLQLNPAHPSLQFHRIEQARDPNFWSARVSSDLRLASAPKIPEKVQVISVTFRRNADVVASVLERAKGICECCGEPAPFSRKSNGDPFLEVHHVKPLADGGEDTVKNAMGVCPNCHRRLHFGTDTRCHKQTEETEPGKGV